MWSRTVDGQVLTFRLLGVNNQNFLMRDEQTGTWWQQVTGEAVNGPLAGKRLRRIPSDEVRLAVWHREHPDTQVLVSEDRFAEAYLSDDWEERIASFPAPPAAVAQAGPLEPRAVVVGVTVAGASKAFPMERLRAERAVADFVGGVPVVVVLDDDGRSARCFERRLGGRTLELFRLEDSATLALVDAETGSTWDFAGLATDGSMAGQRLTAIQTLTSYWFDWRNQNAGTQVYGPSLIAEPVEGD